MAKPGNLMRLILQLPDLNMNFPVITRIIACLAIVHCSSETFAQELVQGKGKAIIYFESPTPVTVRLDTALLRQTKNPILLNEGSYIVRAWAPTKELYTDTITIKEGKTTICVKTLKNSEGYSAYLEELSSYKLKKTGACYVALPATLLYSGFAYFKYKQNARLMNEHLENAQSAKEGYEHSISLTNISIYKERYYSEKAIYESYLKKNNRLANLSCVVIPAGLVASAALIYWSGKLKKPIYSETPLLSLNSISITREFDRDYSLSLLINIR
ncbi:MAG: hypothetical protein JWO44_2033 [Bacteroidetes bacterium]|nr:hypothetical protein [Bacteroidota bacterium]